MQNKEGIFSFNELLKLKDFCNNCAKEDKKIHEKRKVNPSYVPEDKKPEPIKKMKAPSYQVSNNSFWCREFALFSPYMDMRLLYL